MTDLIPEPSRGIQLLADLEATGAVTPVALVLPPDIPFDQYLAMATMFSELHKRTAWYIGDLLNYGEKMYGEKYAQAEAVTGLNKTTLMNYASVCGQIPRSQRRPNLNFSIHAEVAYLEPTERKEWLDKAAANDWKREDLRAARHGHNDELPPAVEVECHCPRCGNRHNPQNAVSP